MNTIFFISLMFALQLFYWVVGRRASKNLKSQEEYLLAGKSVRFFPLMMTFLATQVGGGLVLGAANEAYQFGWPVLFYPLGASLGLLLLGVVGRKLAQFKVSTVAELFELIYGSVKLRKLASLLSILALFMILVAQIIASNKFLVSVGFSNTPLFMLFWAIVIAYTVQGGLKAVISTDLVQAAFFTLVFLSSFAFVLYFEPTVKALSMPQLENFSQVSSKLSGWLLMPFLFMVIEQDMGQRCFAGSSPQTVSRASIVAGLVTMAVCFVPIFLGVLARDLGLVVPSSASVLMAVVEATTTPALTALVGCAVLAAIISTATSLINAISSNVASDFSWPQMQGAKGVRLIQGATTLICIFALFFAFYFDNVVDLLIQSYELSVSCFFVPILFALYKKRGNVLSALLAILSGALGFIIFRIFPIDFPKEIASLLLSQLGYFCGELYVLLQMRLGSWSVQKF